MVRTRDANTCKCTANAKNEHYADQSSPGYYFIQDCISFVHRISKVHQTNHQLEHRKTDKKVNYTDMQYQLQYLLPKNSSGSTKVHVLQGLLLTIISNCADTEIIVS